MLKFDWNFLFTLINLVIFYLLMKRFLFKPIMKVMNKRREMIDKQFKDAEDVNAEANELKKLYEEKIQDIDRESDRILSEAKENAAAEYGKILDRAETDAKKLKEEAKKQADEECENAVRAARINIADIAMEAAEKVLGANVSEKTNSDIFDEFLKESSESNESQN